MTAIFSPIIQDLDDQHLELFLERAIIRSDLWTLSRRLITILEATELRLMLHTLVEILRAI